MNCWIGGEEVAAWTDTQDDREPDVRVPALLAQQDHARY
jgi:hypothetical protein